MTTVHRAAAVGVRAACPQELWWGHVPPHEGLWPVPGAAVKAGAFLGSTVAPCQAVRRHLHQRHGCQVSAQGALTSPEQLQTWTLPG